MSQHACDRANCAENKAGRSSTRDDRRRRRPVGVCTSDVLRSDHKNIDMAKLGSVRPRNRTNPSRIPPVTITVLGVTWLSMRGKDSAITIEPRP